MKILSKTQAIPLLCLVMAVITLSPAQGQKRDIVTSNNKQGVMNDAGVEIIPCQYDLIETKGGNYYVYKEGRQGVFNPYGVEILPCRSSEISVLKNKDYYHRNADNKKCGIVNPYGIEIVPAKYDEIVLKEKNYYVRDGKLNGIFNPYGVEIVPCKFSEITLLKNGNYYLQNTDSRKYGIINPYGVVVIPAKYDEIVLKEKNYYVREGRLNGIFNPYGVEIVPCKFSEINLLKNGQYLVRHSKTEKLGVINAYGVEVVPCKYDAIFPEGDSYRTRIGYNATTFSQYGGEANKTGNHKVIYSKPQRGKSQQNTFGRYEQVTLLKNNRYLVKKENKYGITDEKGKLLIGCQYDKLNELKREIKLKDKNSEIAVDNNINPEPLYVARKDNKYGLLNHRGKVMLDFIYDDITLDEQDNIIIQVKGTQKTFKIKDFNK